MPAMGRGPPLLLTQIVAEVAGGSLQKLSERSG